MPHYEFFCHTCSKPFSKTLTPTEYKEGKVVCPRCGSEEVEQRWFYPVTAKRSA
jgi:putative FmdB family regulatory protein